jgi:hypothetical protein
MDANGYITFDLSAAPKSLTATDHVIKVLVNIVGGSSRTTSLSLQRTADATLIDSELNVPILVQANSTTFSARTSGTQTITSGTLTITKKTDSASSNVVKGASNVSLASYEFKAAGEAIKVETLRANVIVSDQTIDELRNGKIYANGVQVGSTADLIASDVATTYWTEYSLGSSLIVNPGTPVTVEIKADIYDSDGTDGISTGDTLQAQIASSTSNAQRQVSLTFLSTPGSDTPGNTLTVKTGSLTCAKYTGYANQTVVIPQTSAYKLGEFRCTAGTTEALNITSFNVDFDASVGPTVATDLSDVYIVYGATTGTAKSTVASTTNAWNVNTTLATGASLAVTVYGKINSTMATTETLEADLTVSATSAGSAAAADSTETTGQTITGTSSGTLATVATEEQLDQLVLGGTTVTAATYKLTATNDAFTVTEVGIFVASGAQNAINKVYFYAEDGTTLLNTGGADMNGVNASSTGMSYLIPANTTKKLIVKLGLNSIATGASAPGYNASTTLDAVKVKNSSGTESTTGDDRQGNAIYVYKTYPVVSSVALTTAERTITNNTSQTIYKFKVAPASGTISVKQLSFTLAWTDTTNPAALELGTLKFFRGTTDITSYVSITNASGVSAKSGGTALAETDTTAGLVISWLTTTEEEISAETTYSIKATPANFDNGTTSSDRVSITMIGDASHIDGQYIGDNNGDGVWKLLTAATTGSGGAGNFIWSDISLNGHSATSGSATADWASGFLVKNLDLDATIMDIKP